MIENVGSPKVNQALGALSVLANTRTVEVNLPVLKTKAMVTPLLGSEELQLETMKVSGATFIQTYNKVLYSHCTFSDLAFENFEDFEKHLTPSDKMALSFGLLDATFSELPERLIKCPKCKTADTYSVSPDALVHDDTFTKEWDKDDYNEFEVTSEIVKGFRVTFQMPTESERLKVVRYKEDSELRNEVESTGDILSPMELFCIYIKRIEIDSLEEDVDTLVLDDKVKDIIPTLKEMPFDLKAKLLDDKAIAIFTEYSPNFYLQLTCGKCAHEFNWNNISPEQDFFRKALSVYN
jgi:hypothetical protein